MRSRASLTRPVAHTASPAHAVLRSIPRRPLSDTSSPPSSKICAVPFKQGLEDARLRLRIHGLIASASLPNVLYAGLLRLFGSSVEPLAKEFGLGESLVLRDMKAALYPVWRVDATAQGKAGLSSSSSDGRRDAAGWIAVREGYIPGNPFAPLSYLSYAVPPLEDDLRPYEPGRDLKQLDGVDIIPVPFTVSPFGVIDALRRAVGRRADWEGLRIDETKWKETMVACYPLLFPIYIAEFESTDNEGGKRTYSIVMDAHDENSGRCRVSFPPPSYMRESGRFGDNYYVNAAPFLPAANFILPLPPTEQASPRTLSAALAQAYQAWMSPPPNGNSIAPSPTLDVAERTGGEIDWSDVRIQSWAGEERVENGEYMEKGLEVHKTISALEAMATITGDLPDGSDPRAVVVTLGSLTRGKAPSISSRPISEMRSELEENVSSLKAELDALKPRWLVQWEKRTANEEVNK